MLRTRLLTALVGIPAVGYLVYAGDLWFLAGALVVGLVAGWEYTRMVTAGHYHTMALCTLSLIALLIVDGFMPGWYILRPGITFILLTSLTWQLFRADTESPTADWALTLAGGLYIGWGLAHLVMQRQLEQGMAYVWLTLLSTWGADTAAYLFGSLFGKRKLWPRLSPQKTWAGFYGSFLGSLIGAGGVTLIFGLNWGLSLTVAALVPIFALFGDVAISMIKRNVGVKDTSQLIPGHGGVLDRLDSILYTSIFVYYCIYLWK